MILKIREAKDGDWAKLLQEHEIGNEIVFEGHSIPEHVWIDLLERLGATVQYEEGDFCVCGQWIPEGTTCDFCETYFEDWDDAEE